VSLPPFFATELFIPRLASFYAAYPDVDIHLDTQEPRPATHAATADVSILLTHKVAQGLKATRLFPLRLAAVCARENAPGVARLGRDVFRHTALIVHSARPLAWATWADEVGLETPKPRRVIELDTMSAVVRAAERGIGVALVPTALCDAWLRSGALVQIFPEELETEDAYFLVTRRGDADRLEVKALTRWALVQLSPHSMHQIGAEIRTTCTV
jgi:LysR family glycine cleavage system transcriptional activator